MWSDQTRGNGCSLTKGMVRLDIGKKVSVSGLRLACAVISRTAGTKLLSLKQPFDSFYWNEIHSTYFCLLQLFRWAVHQLSEQA